MRQGLKPHAEDAEFRKKWAAIKFHNKQALAAKIKEWTGIQVPVAALYDIHIKRIHEYKRQYMNLVSVIYRYKQIKVGTAVRPEYAGARGTRCLDTPQMRHGSL